MNARTTRAGGERAAQARVTANAENPADSANLDVNGGTKDDDQPSETKMPRARHEIVTGQGEDDKIAPGTFITNDIVELHDLDEKTIARLTRSGAIELVDVIKA